jgi:hypothetical protein
MYRGPSVEAEDAQAQLQGKIVEVESHHATGNLSPVWADPTTLHRPYRQA